MAGCSFGTAEFSFAITVTRACARTRARGAARRVLAEMADLNTDAAARARQLADFQFDIYERGVAGEVPAVPIAAEELRERARAVLAPQAYGYVAGAAGVERTLEADLRPFDRWQILPRVLRELPPRPPADRVPR